MTNSKAIEQLITLNYVKKYIGEHNFYNHTVVYG